MSARPIIAGRLYRVRHAGQTLNVIAANPWDALLIVLDQLEVQPC
jgi:hypothetical protein